jgi:hypothetical protein
VYSSIVREASCANACLPNRANILGVLVLLVKGDCSEYDSLFSVREFWIVMVIVGSKANIDVIGVLIW